VVGSSKQRDVAEYAIAKSGAAAALRKLPVRSWVIDGEAIVCDANGLAVFDLLRRWGGNDVVLCYLSQIDSIPSLPSATQMKRPWPRGRSRALRNTTFVN
jgi:hypothetical protein